MLKHQEIDQLGSMFADRVIGDFLTAAKCAPQILEEKLKEVGQSDPGSIRTLLTLMKGAGLETLGDVSASSNGKRYPFVIGQRIGHPGVPFGQLTLGGNTLNLNLIPDVLRTDWGYPTRYKLDDAMKLVAALNGGVKYETEGDINLAVERREFKDGAFFLSRQQDLEKIARDRTSDPALKQLNSELNGYSNLDRGGAWVLSSTKMAASHPRVIQVRLSDGFASSWNDDPGYVIVLRGTLAKPGGSQAGLAPCA